MTHLGKFKIGLIQENFEYFDNEEYLKGLIEKNGYLPYPHIKALEELTPAEVLFGLEIKWEKVPCI